jgi:hypothetical protein
LSLIFGGYMETDVTDSRTRAPVRMGALRADTELEIVWRKCRFLALHPLLGEVHIDLDEAREPSRGTVVPVAKRVGGQQPGFFPAYNENRFYFVIRVPRLRAEFRSELPIVNAAEIDAIPPIGVPYPLSSPVEFSSNRRWLPSLKLIACVVRMMNEERLSLKVEHASVSSGRGRLAIRIHNISGRSPLKVFWHVSAPPGIVAAPPMGVLTMSRPSELLQLELDGRARPGEAAVTVSAGIIAPQEVPGARGEVVRLVF